MQRNVLYSQIARFVMSAIILVLLSGCAATPWNDDLVQNETTKPGQTATPPSTATPPASVQTIPGEKNKVALLVPMTGKGSEAGQAMLNAAQLAMFDLGADAFELIPEDTGSSATFAANDAIQKGAKIILGPLFAADVKAVSPIAMQAGVNVVSFSTDTTATNPNTFTLGFLPQSHVNRVLEYAGSKSLTRIALIAPRDAYGEAVASTFDTSLRQRGLTSAGVLRYDGAQPSAEELKQFTTANSFNAVLIAANATQSSAIAQSLPANVQKLGTGLWDQANSTQYPSLAGAWYATSSPKLRARFETHYRTTYGEAAPRLASIAYDAAALAVVLSKQGQGFGRNTLTNPNGFAGIDGIFRLQPDGQNERGLAALQIGSGQATIIQEGPSSFR